MRHATSIVILFILSPGIATAAVEAEKRMEIPLKDVWALNMPGTRNIREFDSPDAEESPVMMALRQVRDSWQQDVGMAVQGEGLEAVEEFHRVRDKDLSRNEVFSNSPVSLVFYTTGVGFYTHVKRIERRGSIFTLQYKASPPPENRGGNQYLAVIPVGSLRPGRYEVKIELLPLERKYVDLGVDKALPRYIKGVCRSFSFRVEEQR